MRRIHKVIEFQADGAQIDHGSAMDYVFPLQSPWDEADEKGGDKNAGQIAL